MSVNVHSAQGFRRYYALKPLDTTYERRFPGPDEDTKRAMQFLALEAVYDRNVAYDKRSELDYYISSSGDVYADPHG